MRGTPLPLVNKGGTAYNLRECEGDCDRDSDCVGALICYQRDYSSQIVPGCEYGGSGDVGHYDYCYNPSRSPQPAGLTLASLPAWVEVVL